ncbi:helix-turn-helix domain-containing protein [Bacillus tropicus]|uniref:helix-turn-helix domain-containing protein n=1 Tax=Bacillus tropicus TaxID=2026188 RepID=UPI003D225D73
MVVKLHVSTKYGLTVHDLLLKERKKNLFFKYVHMSSNGRTLCYISAAQIIEIYRQSVSTYVQTFGN